MKLHVNPAAKLQGEISVPGDKSISHRAVMFGSLAEGKTTVKGFLMGEDCLSTVRCFRALGVPITVTDTAVEIQGSGLYGLTEPEDVLDVGNSGTTIRLMAGILAGQDFTSVMTGDASIRKRPMGRIADPLRKMGATILGRNQGALAPLTIKGTKLKPLTYHTPVASAQVKSSILLAGMYASEWTEVIEPEKSRDHTERMLTYLGAEVQSQGLSARIKGNPILQGKEIVVPGDISSAAFLLVAASIVPQAEITIKNVGLNPTRTGIIEVLSAMGANIQVKPNPSAKGEPFGDVTISSGTLKGIQISGPLIPRLVDEIPVIAVAAACAQGITEIRDAAELKVKESNRLEAISKELHKMGVDIEELPDGLRIRGGKKLKGNVGLKSWNDHRIAMALAVAGLVADAPIEIAEPQSIEVSFPGFEETIRKLQK